MQHLLINRLPRLHSIPQRLGDPMPSQYTKYHCPIPKARRLEPSHVPNDTQACSNGKRMKLHGARVLSYSVPARGNGCSINLHAHYCQYRDFCSKHVCLLVFLKLCSGISEHSCRAWKITAQPISNGTDFLFHPMDQ